MDAKISDELGLCWENEVTSDKSEVSEHVPFSHYSCPWLNHKSCLVRLLGALPGTTEKRLCLREKARAGAQSAWALYPTTLRCTLAHVSAMGLTGNYFGTFCPRQNALVSEHSDSLAHHFA